MAGGGFSPLTGIEVPSITGALIFAADFGGSRIKLGLVDHGVVQANGVMDSPAGDEFSEWWPVLKERAELLCHQQGVSLASLDGMVWALPLIIDPGLRRATCSFGKFEDTTGPDFCERVEDLFGIPLLLENDARAAAIGEWQAGAGRDRKDLAMVTLGTGIGTGVILDGKPLRGRSGMAGNLGGLSVTHLGSPGAESVPPGCTEGQVATWALPQRAAGLPGFHASPLFGEGRLNYEAVFAHAVAGDPVACRLRDDALEAWGALALNLVQAYDPERVIFGGGIMAAGELILPAVREFVNQHAVQAGGPVDIVAGALGDRAAPLGCEWIWQNAGPR